MSEKAENGCCCLPSGQETGCCKIESLVSVDERGQMVLPKEVRDKLGIHAGDKLAIISWEKEGRICCLSLIKTAELTEMVKGRLGPLMTEILRK